MSAHKSYKKNFVKKAVVEIRFPILMELGHPSPPASFVKGIRKLFPNHNGANQLNLGRVGDIDNSTVHVFRSANNRMKVSLRTSMISIETEGAYGGFEKLREALYLVVHALMPVIETDFFTRIGLRYINVIECKAEPWDGWICPDLVAPLAHGKFKGVFEYSGRLCFSDENIGCLFNHGIKFDDENLAPESMPHYALDIDVFQDVVEFVNWERSLEDLHVRANNVFEWAIDSKTREELSSD
jgi:uncharacterized protein (TIGR04255 family)